MMIGKFIFSLDCEGKWGSADKLSAPHVKVLTEVALKKSYSQIIDVLDTHQIRSSFAFVTCFAMSVKQQLNAKAKIEKLSKMAPGYLTSAIEQLGTDGWVGDWAVDMVASAKVKHELAWHGATHTPWNLLTSDAAREEIAIQKECDSFIKGNIKTFVYPRNQILHIDQLHDAGIIGYRKQKHMPFRGSHLLEELQINGISESFDAQSDSLPAPIPAGHFLSWRYGIRKLVPRALLLRRLKSMLDHAARTGGIVHLWTHPENFVSGAATIELLREVAKLVSEYVNKGKIKVLTMEEFVMDLGGAHQLN